MKLISYTATRPGIAGIGSLAVRLGTNSKYSHTEIVFEEGDMVDDIMPDGTTKAIDGTLWCASSTTLDIIPSYSLVRPGRKGGVRFKRIKINPDHWFVQDISNHFDPEQVATWFLQNQGMAYDYRGIAGYVGALANLIFHHNEGKVSCTEACATALGFKDSWRFHPGNLPVVIDRISSNKD